MKKIIIMLAFLFFPVFAGAQTVDISATEHTKTKMLIVAIEWTADAAGDVTADFDSDADIPDLSDLLAGRVCTNARSIPGSAGDDPARTPPTDDYDITISTPGGLSVFGARIDDRSATVEEIASPLVSRVADDTTSVFPYAFVDSSLAGEIWTFTVSGAGNGGQGTLYLFFR